MQILIPITFASMFIPQLLNFKMKIRNLLSVHEKIDILVNNQQYEMNGAFISVLRHSFF